MINQHLVTNDEAWHLVRNADEQKQHLVTSGIAFYPVSNADKVSPETGPFMFYYLMF